MKVLICSGGGEPPYSSNQGVIYGLRSLGHEVVSIGSRYWGRCFCDIELPDRKFPEYYTYNEVLEKVSFTPEIVIQCEPHFYLTGSKPPEIKSCYIIFDPHRGAKTFRRLAGDGSFNVVFCSQLFFLPIFQGIPGARTEWLPQAFNESRFKWDVNAPILADVVFIGETGIAGIEYSHEDGLGEYATKPPQTLEANHKRFQYWHNYSFEYAERAELLIRLCRDFNVRMYYGIRNENYQAALQSGMIGFNRSLLSDVTIRNFEVMAAGRLLLTDEIPGQEKLFQDSIHCRTYPTYGFHPLFDNFSCEYENVYNAVKYHLDHTKETEEIIKRGHELAWERGTWEKRAAELLEKVLN